MSDSDRHLSRATVIAAVIGATGAIVAAIVGHRAGQEQSSHKLDLMEKQLAQSSAAIVELRSRLNAESQRVEELRRRLERAGQDGDPIVLEEDGPTRQTDHDFRFDLKGCKRSTSKITCSVLVTNLGVPRTMKIDRIRSRLLSEAGDEYVATWLRLGADEGGFWATTSIPAGRSISGELVFASVKPNTTSFQTLQVGGSTWGAGVATRNTSVTFPSVIAR